MGKPNGWELLAQIASVSEAVGRQSGTGAQECAGMIVSHLYNDPRLIDRFMTEGVDLLIDGTVEPGGGRLTFMSRRGEVLTPAELRLRKEPVPQPQEGGDG